jgi:DNA-binding response OmpR family regulator
VEGLQADADDYLVKPSAARELLARVATHVKMANLRRESAEREGGCAARRKSSARNCTQARNCWPRPAAFTVNSEP